MHSPPFRTLEAVWPERNMKFQVVCDSSADLPREFAEENQISIVPYYISLDDETYLREGIDSSIPDFYQAMVRTGYFPPRGKLFSE